MRKLDRPVSNHPNLFILYGKVLRIYLYATFIAHNLSFIVYNFPLVDRTTGYSLNARYNAGKSAPRARKRRVQALPPYHPPLQRFLRF